MRFSAAVVTVLIREAKERGRIQRLETHLTLPKAPMRHLRPPSHDRRLASSVAICSSQELAKDLADGRNEGYKSHSECNCRDSGVAGHGCGGTIVVVGMLGEKRAEPHRHQQAEKTSRLDFG